MGIKKFKVNYIYSEYLETKKSTGGENPIPLLKMRAVKSSEAEKQAFVEKHLDGVDFDDDEEYFDYIFGRYPESKQDIIERAYHFSDLIVKKYGQ